MELKPETERLIQEEIRSGYIQSVDELIVCGVRALRERRQAEARHDKPRKRLIKKPSPTDQKPRRRWRKSQPLSAMPSRKTNK